jgi:hypothetical protein
MTYSMLLYAHSYYRYVVFALLIAVLVASLAGWLGKRPFTNWDNRFSLYFFISVHTMLLLGLVLYFVSPKVHFGGLDMKDGLSRYWTVEHITANLLAIVAFSLGRIQFKKQLTDAGKHRILFVFTAIGAVILIGSLTGGIYAPGLFGSSIAH